MDRDARWRMRHVRSMGLLDKFSPLGVDPIFCLSSFRNCSRLGVVSISSERQDNHRGSSRAGIYHR